MYVLLLNLEINLQPPSGGCVLKQIMDNDYAGAEVQPPSGGCVLKHEMVHLWQHEFGPAAFRRLCVETNNDGL